MERLTYDFAANGQHCWQVKGADNALCKEVCRDQGDSGCKDCPIAKAFDRLAAYEDAEEQGRLLVLPCKVGDTVYTIIGRKIYEGEVYHISYSNYYGKVASSVWAKSGFLTAGIGAAFEDFGKTVFLTREEAEAALKREGSNEN